MSLTWKDKKYNTSFEALKLNAVESSHQFLMIVAEADSETLEINSILSG
jgi:hypothetical protein